jgi:Bacterial protein of unknown function (DUF922)
MSITYSGPRRDTYAVGGSLADVVAAIQQREEAGKASWNPVYTYNQEDGTITSVDVTCEMAIEMPVWSDYASANAEDRAEWDRFLAALEIHEQGHIQIVQVHLDAVDSWFVGQPASQAAQLWQDGLARLQADSDGYDADTGHGVYYGCSITVSESESAAGESEGEQ